MHNITQSTDFFPAEKIKFTRRKYYIFISPPPPFSHSLSLTLFLSIDIFMYYTV